MYSKSTSAAICLILITTTLSSRADETKITLDAIPAGPRQTIEASAGDGKIISVEKAVENGATTYEALTETKAGKQVEFVVAEGGKLESTEEHLTLRDVPGRVSKTIKAETKGGEIKSIEKVTAAQAVTYEVGYKTDQGAMFELVVSPEGKMLKKGEDKD